MPNTPLTTDLGPKVAASKHPSYDLFQPVWEKLAHVREGTGGFLDGTYLVGHPREWKDHDAVTPKTPTKKLTARRNLAHYENLASAILEAKKSSLFRESAVRRVGDGSAAKSAGIEEWWQDVDGSGTSMADAVPLWWDLAATFGHTLLYFELPAMDGSVTAADQGAPYVRAYTPLDAYNWLVDANGQVTSILLVEVVPPATYMETPTTQYQTRIVDTERWTVYDKQGAKVDEGEHGLGRLPVVMLYGKKRAVLQDVGEPVLGDPKLYIDLYNLESELRELLRNQTFSFINVPLGTGADAMSVEQAITMIGQQTGTMNVLFSGLPAQMLTADVGNVTAYQEQIAKRKRDIFRVAGVPWESDSRDAEAADSLRIKREELNTRLSMYADNCQEAELALADLWYRWRHGAEIGPSVMERDIVTVQYPGRFDAAPFEELLQQIQAAQSISMPAAFLKVLRKALVPKFEGMASLPETELQTITNEIDAAEDEPTPAEEAKLRLEAQKLALAGTSDEDNDADADAE